MFRLAIVLSTALASVGLGAPTAAGCDRATLLSAADAYVAAQTAGKLDALQKVTSPTNFTYMENNAVTDINKSVLVTALKIDHRRSTVDTVQCATYSEVISTSGPKQYVIGTQIRHDPASMQVILVDTIASTTGSWAFNATKTLSYVLQEQWPEIPVDKRDDRGTLQRAADAYMDIWSNSTAAAAVPWGTPCDRLEGSSYTGKGLPTDSCNVGIPSNHNQAPNIRRRYVIDESAGSCSLFCVWQHMMNAADSHEFRLENGKLRYVHTITVCPGQTCRL